METTEYQSRIEGLNGTALVLPLSAPVVMSRVSEMYWFSRGEPGNYRLCWSTDDFVERKSKSENTRVLRTFFEFDDCLVAGRLTENQVITGSGFHHRFH